MLISQKINETYKNYLEIERPEKYTIVWLLERAHSGILMLLFVKMAVNINRKKPLHQMMMDYSIHKVSFLNSIAPKSFRNFGLFFIQLIFMHEAGKCPKHSRSESLILLCHCRDPLVIAVSQKYWNFKNGRRLRYRSSFETSLCKSIKIWFSMLSLFFIWNCNAKDYFSL